MEQELDAADARAGRRGRALVIANRLPYPVDDGWKRRTFHVVRALCRRYRVTLVTLQDRTVIAAPRLIAEIGAPLEVSAVRSSPLTGALSLGLGLVTDRPFHVWRVRSAGMRRLVSELNGRQPFDVAVATLTHLHGYLELLDRATLRIVDTHNIDSVVLGRYAARMRGPRARYARLSARKLERHEAAALARTDLVWVCSEEERQLLGRTVPPARIAVIPNGVDTEWFAPVGHDPVRGRLVFFGRLDYYPNADAVDYFARQVLPLIRREFPQAELVVAGPGAGSELRALARRTAGLSLIGPAVDLRPIIGSADVVVVPLRSGGGTRLKILEALAMGKAVVSTSVGAEGLAVEPGREICIADETRAFAGAVVDVLRSRELRESLGAAGRERVREDYDWRGIEQRLLASIASGAPLGAPVGESAA